MAHGPRGACTSTAQKIKLPVIAARRRELARRRPTHGQCERNHSMNTPNDRYEAKIAVAVVVTAALTLDEAMVFSSAGESEPSDDKMRSASEDKLQSSPCSSSPSLCHTGSSARLTHSPAARSPSDSPPDSPAFVTRTGSLVPFGSPLAPASPSMHAEPKRALRGCRANLSIVTAESSGDASPTASLPPMSSRGQPPGLWVCTPGSRPGSADHNIRGVGASCSSQEQRSGSTFVPPPIRALDSRPGSAEGMRVSSRPGSASSGSASRPNSASHGFLCGGVARPLSQRKQLQLYERVLTIVVPGLYVGANAAAREVTLLHQAGVTHVINCAAGSCADHHPQSFKYMRLYLKDSMREDIAAAFYDALEYIHTAIQNNGVVFVHCQQGVSRSAAIVLAYLMWVKRASYEAALDLVRAERPTVNPNIGFACALLAWGELLIAPPNALHAWACERTVSVDGDDKISEASCLGGVWVMRNIALSGASAPDETLSQAIDCISFSVAEKKLPLPAAEAYLLFQRGTRAVCWSRALLSTAARASVERHWKRLQLFHGLPECMSAHCVHEGVEGDSFWELLHGTSLTAEADVMDIPVSERSVTEEHASLLEAGCERRSERRSEARAGTGSERRIEARAGTGSADAETLRLQMQMTALQHLLSEMLLALQAAARMLDGCFADGGFAVSEGHAKVLSSCERLQAMQHLLVSQPDCETDCESSRTEMLQLLCELTPHLGVGALAKLRAPLDQFAAQLQQLDGEALLRAEELLLASLRDAIHELEAVSEAGEMPETA
eukprot:CAMPEP_0119363778 /NCGR_PEP_ID=MMETSP1334-20130426/10709_1 /TAXON_ID=127549 /ORGANISM="Calcidiscus leptoporus, Strain RCC1130" /LENGTH=782 /DNA_ID=CAMNT_0007379321 /DNA_START=112 /DNA_END=2461 /DNA_ORIENTATION=-